jgi:hypothetical protein
MLEEALYYDQHLMGALQRRGCVEMDNPLDDILYYWDEDALNTDTVTVSGSVASNGTSSCSTPVRAPASTSATSS